MLTTNTNGHHKGLANTEDLLQVAEGSELKISSHVEPKLSRKDTVSQKDWSSQSLQEKFLAYEKAYRQTGHTEFAAMEAVARMAGEGPIFVPDRAEKIISEFEKITANTSRIVPELQRILDHAVIRKGVPLDQVHQQLLALDTQTVILTHSVDKYVTLLNQLISTEWREQIKKAMCELDYTKNYLLERLVLDLTIAQPLHQDQYERISKYLVLINSKTNELVLRIGEIIISRVPFYKFSGED